MNKDKLIKQISIWRNPDKFIELLENTSNQKFFWYQKLILKTIMKKNKMKAMIKLKLKGKTK